MVVPARNEASTIGGTVSSISTALHALPDNISTTFVVVLDCCTDDTADVLENAVRRSPRWSTPPVVVRSSFGCAGAARALGVRTALDHVRGPLRSVWLANTDADTSVPSTWLVEQVALADRGADGVAGIVDLDDSADERLRRAFGRSYALGLDGTHHHVHGANLGVRADRYLQVGGWRAMQTGEDHDLWNRVRVVGDCVSTTSVVVRTSGRLAGRAPAGFASDLADLAGSGLTVA
ncbi:MAG: glycosyltransferase [Ilumatobacteraceae bacterium]